jgi:GT2 family glycosyltransferase
MDRLIIGFITYDDLTAKYLPYFLPSITSQTYKDFQIICVDNSGNDSNPNREYIGKGFSGIPILWQKGKNIGFGAAHNIMIRQAVDLGAKYYLALNPDLILENDCLERMVAELENDQKLGSIAPKILKWDFANLQKTDRIDSCGIIMKKGLKFADLGQGEIDSGQFDGAGILGPSGAAALYRISALQIAKEDKNFFDENLFMYKEDCDLAYRLHLKGFGSKLAKDAIAYHDRTVFGKGDDNIDIVNARKNKSKRQKAWSFLNQQLIYYKYWCVISWQDKLVLIWRQIETLAFIALFEQFLFAQLVELWTIRKNVKIYRK